MPPLACAGHLALLPSQPLPLPQPLCIILRYVTPARSECTRACQLAASEASAKPGLPSPQPSRCPWLVNTSKRIQNKNPYAPILLNNVNPWCVLKAVCSRLPQQLHLLGVGRLGAGDREDAPHKDDVPRHHTNLRYTSSSTPVQKCDFFGVNVFGAARLPKVCNGTLKRVQTGEAGLGRAVQAAERQAAKSTS